MKLALMSVVLLVVAGCSDGDSQTLGDVTVTSTGASAVYGGCGDAPPPPSDAGPPPPCGPAQDFSVALRLQSSASVARTVAIVGVAVLDASGQELNKATVSNVLTGGAAFDGKLPAGATMELKVELDPVWLALPPSQDTIGYRVSLTVDGKAVSVESPTTIYSGPPA